MSAIPSYLEEESDGGCVGYNPAAEAFKSFDQDQSSNLLGSLHLDTDDEPRRGASRANSVRFDESALHGHFSRTSTDFLPLRTGSGLGGGSLPMTERTSSHKSDGRHSSAGASVGSARASNFGPESRPLSATVPSFISSGPTPGLFILGPVPSIIRCWLTTTYSNDSLIYAAICTGSCKSILAVELITRLDLQNQVKSGREGQRTLKLPVYLPEATIQQSSSRSSSPVPQLPAVTVDFEVHEFGSRVDQIQILLGSDILRARSADIQFSLDRITLFDDDRNKLSVPLVRPENANLFQNLVTSHRTSEESSKLGAEPHGTGSLERSGELSRFEETKARQDPGLDDSSKGSLVVNGTTRKSTNVSEAGDIQRSASPEESRASTSTGTEKTPTRSEAGSGSIWGSWRRDSTLDGQASGSRDANSSSSGYQRVGRGRGMKILKPARLNTSSSITSTPQPPVGFDAAAARTAGPDTSKSTAPSSAAKPKSANPVGGASAFGWLNPGQQAVKPASAAASGEGP